MTLETSETFWQAAVGFLGLAVGGLLAVIKLLASKLHARTAPRDVVTVQLMRRDIAAVEAQVRDLTRAVGELARRNETQDLIDKRL